MRKLSHGCTLDCFDCCKFNVYVKDDNILKIEGDKEHPFTKGIICKKGRAHLERLNHKDRIYSPLIKIDGEWKEISFEEAINIMSEKLNFYKDKYSTQSVMYYEQYGSGSILKSIGEIFFNFYGGGSRQIGTPCWGAGIKAQKYDFGYVRGHAIEDMLNSKSIFVWGKNPAYTTIHTMQMITKAKQNGSKIVVIDPIYTSTARMADKYVRINPGSDGALAFAMAKIIIEKDLYDKAYIDNHVYGFKEYKAYANSLDLNYLLKECGLKEIEVEELVALYTQKYSSIHIGIGMQKYTNGGNTIRVINSLGAISGQIGFSGGGVNYANMVYPNILNLDPYNSKKHCKSREFQVAQISEFIDKTHEDIDKGIPIKMAVIVKSNLLNQLPNLEKLEKSIDNIEFKVCFDMFMTDTAKACDLFIPCSNTLESEDIVFSSMTNPYIIYNERVIEPKHKLMDEYYFFRKLAKNMKIKEYPQVSKNDYLNKIIKPLKAFDESLNLNKIKNNFITIHNNIAWEDKKFDTKTGKFELYSKEAETDGLDPVAKYVSIKKENRFRILTNHHTESLFSQHFMDKKGISIAYINHNMATMINIENNEVVSLKSKHAKINVQINIDDSVSDYVVKMYAGWWKKHGNPNFLIEGGISDMGGQVVYNETFVDIIKQK
ncbi:MAG: molybdopterin-dependent oxidoreductase [Romboutsia sp.]|uniref:molybdopterin-dependent oxidoreductase n=1 Tax=Romboutsia sp. TaxID=1965302 RepID=UPI003F3FB2C5